MKDSKLRIEHPDGAKRRVLFGRAFWCAGLLFVLMGALRRPKTAHELADGELERWCEVVVRDELIQLRYSIGYNTQTEATVTQVLGIDSGSPAEAGQGGGVAGKPMESSEGDRDREIWKESLGRYVTQHVQLDVGGAARTPLRCEVIPSGRHPMCWFVALEFEAPRELSSFQLTVVDSAFRSFPGPARQAIRSKSRWELSESNAAPLLVRAKAEVWSAESESSPSLRPGARIEAELVDVER